MACSIDMDHATAGSFRWEIEIFGEARILAELSTRVVSAKFSVERRDHRYWLLGDVFANAQHHSEVRIRAERIIATLRGAVAIISGVQGDVSVSAIFQIFSDGSKAVFARLEDKVAFYDAVQITVHNKNGEEERTFDAFQDVYGLVLSDSNVAKVSRLLSGDRLSWSELYKAYEVIVNDVGGLKAVIDQGWASKLDLSRFRHSANSPIASGDDARHGVEGHSPPINPLALEAARCLVRRIALRWVLDKAGSYDP